MDNTLLFHVTSRLRSGVSQADIKKDLLAVGWTEDQANAAIAEGLVAFGVPAPQGRAAGGIKSSVAEVAVNFFSFVLLGVIVWAAISLYYGIINRYFPDPLVDRYAYAFSTRLIHYATAALIVAYPIYYMALRIWFKRFREDEKKVESGLTKFLTYIVLLIASGAIVGDLITALFYFFQGEITIRFILKVLTVLFVGGVVFSFYFLERKKIQYGHDIPRKTFTSFGVVVSVFVVIGIILGFLTAGSPATARDRGFDLDRSQNLRNISSSISTFAYNFKRLPASLEEVTTSSTYLDITDPETGKPYEYRIIVAPTGAAFEGTYELCADFALASDQNGDYYNDAYSRYSAGKSCFMQSVSTQTR